MGRATYTIIQKGNAWTMLHDGETPNEYHTKESAFEAAVLAASLAIREGHEVLVAVPGHHAGKGTGIGAQDTH